MDPNTHSISASIREIPPKPRPDDAAAIARAFAFSVPINLAMDLVASGATPVERLDGTAKEILKEGYTKSYTVAFLAASIYDKKAAEEYVKGLEAKRR